jgi:hypothetical protein
MRTENAEMEFSAFSGLQRGQRFWHEVDWTAHCR